MKNVRCYNNVYTHRITVAPGTANNGSSPMYFQSSTNLLKGKTIKAIETVIFQPFPTSFSPAPWYLTLVNFNKEILLFNFPLIALSTINETPTGRLQLFNLFDVDINNSFWIVASGTGWGPAITNPYNILFYY